MRDQENHTAALAELVAAILKRDGKDVTNMSALDRLRELHESEELLRYACNVLEDVAKTSSSTRLVRLAKTALAVCDRTKTHKNQ